MSNANSMLDLEKNGKNERVLLHSCCAPCSSYCITYLKEFAKITVFYYNPCIEPRAEYLKRKAEQLRLIDILGEVDYLDSDYEADAFARLAAGLEKEPEGGRRCLKCFEQRLNKTAQTAQLNGFDLFATTLTISPHKNAEIINQIGMAAADRFNAKYLPSDFKKKDGYKKSIEYSKEYGLYRQNYCGCAYSKSFV